MNTRVLGASGLGYAQANLLQAPSRLLFVSGQVPVTPEGDTPEGFDAQCRLVWRNLEAQLIGAGMGLPTLVKVTTFLSDRAHRAANTRIRHEVLGDISPALTVLISGIFDEAWLLEIEAIAAA